MLKIQGIAAKPSIFKSKWVKLLANSFNAYLEVKNLQHKFRRGKSFLLNVIELHYDLITSISITYMKIEFTKLSSLEILFSMTFVSWMDV